ncbi:hypothetical protein NP493_570g01013 [Ridgeia piscesae]|uniref:CCHC-type domain-containing protein n=1 Tax=Ridgeia piscesae TaxID=27915 RepID=A0AAD9NRE2_RIDPI|nr:hypothetical protein NP493_570g01013 [Ridgeia piscesae]
MEKATATEDEDWAFALLRDTTLKRQFIQGVQEHSVCQKLMLIALHSADKPFHHIRNEALYLLDEEQPGARQGRGSSPVSCRFLEMRQMQLHINVIQLASQQCQTAGQMQVVIDQLPSLAGQPQLAAPARSASSTRPNPRDGSCFYCMKQGHFIKECPKKRVPSKRCNRRGTSCFHCKQEGHFARDCPPKTCVDMRNSGPEQSSAQVTHLASDRNGGCWRQIPWRYSSVNR